MYKLFEIPVYNCSRKNFHRKLIKNINKKKEKLKSVNLTDDEIQDYLSMELGNKRKYEDYQVGVLEIWLELGSLSYILKICTIKKYGDAQIEYANHDIKNFKKVPYNMPLFTNKKHYRDELPFNGLHTPITGLSNSEIKEAIYNDIKIINGEGEYKKLYFYLDDFNDILDFLNINGYIERKRKKCDMC